MSKIVVYDSGVGGLSIHQHIVAKCPGHDCVFVSDTAAFPYGTKAETELVARVCEISDQIVEQLDPDVLVVACNTASTIALPRLRQRHAVNVVGVVPAIKPAAMLSTSRHIGLLATPAAISREYTQRLIDEFIGDGVVVRVGSSQLVEMVEASLRGKAIDMAVLSTILQPFVDDKMVDVLVLACTHFPLIYKEIDNILNSNSRKIDIIDSGSAIANRVAEFVPHNTQASAPASVLAFLTQEAQSAELMRALHDYGFSSVQLLSPGKQK